jgi:hypothetical protein
MATPRTIFAGPNRPSSPALALGPGRPPDALGDRIAVLINALVSGGGSLIHVSLGWLVMALLLMRLVWGVLGPSEARFSAFPPNPSRRCAIGQLLSGRVEHYPSHNPGRGDDGLCLLGCAAVVAPLAW